MKYELLLELLELLEHELLEQLLEHELLQFNATLYTAVWNLSAWFNEANISFRFVVKKLSSIAEESIPVDVTDW